MLFQTCVAFFILWKIIEDILKNVDYEIFEY